MNQLPLIPPSDRPAAVQPMPGHYLTTHGMEIVRRPYREDVVQLIKCQLANGPVSWPDLYESIRLEVDLLQRHLIMLERTGIISKDRASGITVYEWRKTCPEPIS